MSVLRAGRVEVAPGDGVLARRPDAVLFVARPSGAATWTDTVAAFVAASSADAALTAVLDHAVDQHLEVGPFAAVTWGDAVHLVVFGDLTVATSLRSVPQLSGAGTPTWVEHRATRFGELSTVRLGDPPSAGTDLRAGIVPAGGFVVTLHAPSVQPVPTRRLRRRWTGIRSSLIGIPDSVDGHCRPVAPPVDETAPPASASPPPPPPPTVTPPSGTASPTPSTGVPTAAAGAGASSWDVLRDAGGAWMDDSLQLSEPRLAAPGLAAGTLATGGRPAAGRRRAPAPDDAFDPEITLDAGALTGAPAAADAPPEPGPFVRYVQARRCPLGHLNPPLRTSCRVCTQYLPPATPVETVPQPALATLVLGDGRAVDVDGPVVLGRTPSAAAARLDEPGTLVTVGDATVSRTHAVVTVDGWTMLATDCAATGGTAIARRGGEPTVLEPWVPHELSVGDTLFLGGPTTVQVVARHD